MGNSKHKTKLVFFQYDYGHNIPEFLLIHKQEHIKCLAESFDIKIITEDSDYQQVCEVYEPDLALFEIGLQINNARQPIIINTHTNPEVAKLAFMNADVWGGTSARILSDMDRWGIETLFSNCVTASEHIRTIVGSIFVWPNFIDSEVFQDYEKPKIIPIMLTGSIDPQYPWRHKIYKKLSAYYPSLICPHLGYSSSATAHQVLIGRQYAHALNASWFVPTCGTVAKEVVRKHLEIPGSRSCLITEKSAALVAAGFTDFKNCIFVDEHDVLDKVTYLFKNQDMLQKIIDEGYRLAQTHHTIKQRDQIYQWFMLSKKLKEKERIIQPNPFKPLEITYDMSQVSNLHISCDGLHLIYARQAEKLLWIGKYEEAERQYFKCLSYTPSMVEARVGIGICNLYLGKPRVALSWILSCIRETISSSKVIDPDPVQWAYLIICLICLGKLHNAYRQAQRFPALQHPELDHARFVVSILTGIKQEDKLVKNSPIIHRKSLHQIPKRTFQKWIQDLCNILIVCRQYSISNSLNSYMQIVNNDANFFDKYDHRNHLLMIVQTTKRIYWRLTGALFQIVCTVPLHGFDNPLLVEVIKNRASNICHKYKNLLRKFFIKA